MSAVSELHAHTRWIARAASSLRIPYVCVCVSKRAWRAAAHGVCMACRALCVQYSIKDFVARDLGFFRLREMTFRSQQGFSYPTAPPPLTRTQIMLAAHTHVPPAI